MILKVEEQLNSALQLRTDKKFVESNKILKELVEVNPEDAYINCQCAWSFDCMGEEESAVPYYEKAIQGNLERSDLENAYLGLGSTFRVLAEYEKSKATFVKAIKLFPDNQALKVFYAMTLYNLQEHQEAMELLLKCVVNTTSDLNLLEYKKAIAFYSDKLDETWQSIK